MPTSLIVLFLGILFLLLLIVVFKLNTFVSLIITAIVVAIGLKIPLQQVPLVVQKGLGDQLGGLAIVFGMGAMLGRLVADAGGAYRIADTLIDKFGRKRVQLAVVVASFILGIAMFFEVGLVLLIPIIFAIAVEAGVSVLYLGIPMAAALSVTHAFLPPHPAPTAISEVLKANPGNVLLYGFVIAIPAIYLAGPVFTRLAQKVVPSAFNKKGNLSSIGEVKEFKLSETPSFLVSVITALFPVILMAISTIYMMVKFDGIAPKDPAFIDSVFIFLGNPSVSMLISLMVAMYTMGWARKIATSGINNSLNEAIKTIGMLLLIVGAGGAFKEVLIRGGISNDIKVMFEGSTLSPLILGWLIAVVLRIALGSATVASITSAGLVLPLMQSANVNPALMVISIGAGSIAFSHVNDAGFWMFKEFFDLSIKETFLTWTMLETIISVVGLVGVLIFSLFI